MGQDVNRIAIVGAGPSGFYAAGQLLKAGWEVDLYDALPTPFGLVRAGVAPDHPNIKAVTRVYEKIAKQDGFRFFGGIKLGEHVQREELLERYDALLYAVGTSADNRLGIPGEDSTGSHPATDFVAWYNGHPEYADHPFDLSAKKAVVVGNGNVAIDVARMLVLDPTEVDITDTADHAIAALADADVQEVVLLGRRGPAQAAFTNPELLELGELHRSDVVVDPADLELDPASQAWLDSDQADGTSKKNVTIMREYATREPTPGREHRIVMKFLRSPLEILSDEAGNVTGVRVAINRIEQDGDRLKAVPTGEEETIECGLVLRSIGYRGVPLPGVPFEERKGLIPNEGGRVTGEDGQPLKGEYVVGWIKRGPSGVIGTNKKDALDTTRKVVEDAEHGLFTDKQAAGAEEVEAWLTEVAPRHVTWTGWNAIDQHETTAGEPHGRPRRKLVRVDEMHDIASGSRA